jgi:nucleoside-diphosphate-sugar epimerase
MNRKPSLDKIRRFIGYDPKYSLDDIIKRMIEYYEN